MSACAPVGLSASYDRNALSGTDFLMADPVGGDAATTSTGRVGKCNRPR